MRIPTRSPIYNPLKPERFFKTGTVVRFCPPPEAYSPQSEQRRQAGKTCLIIRCWNDSMATVTFGQGRAVTINLDYVQEIK